MANDITKLSDEELRRMAGFEATPPPVAGIQQAAPAPTNEAEEPPGITSLSDEELRNLAYGGVSDTYLPPLTRKESSPLLVSKPVTDVDIQELASKHGVDPKWLADTVGWFGGVRQGGETVPEVAKSIVGAVTRGALGGVPQWIYKKMQDDPAARAALDDLSDMVSTKTAWVPGIAAGITGAAVPALAATRAAQLGGRAAGIAAGAAEGAAYGVAGSREGQEVQGGLIGLGIGSLLSPVVISGVGRRVGAARDRLSQWAAEKMIPVEMTSNIERAATTAAREWEELDRTLVDLATSDPEAVVNNIAKFQRAVPEDILSKIPMDAPLKKRVSTLESSLRLKDWRKLEPDDIDRSILRFYVRAGVDPKQTATDWVRREVAQDYLVSLAKFLDPKAAVEGVGIREAADIIQQRVAQEGADWVRKQAANVRIATEIGDRVRSWLDEQIPNTVLGRAAKFLLDAKYVYRAVDRKYGLQTERTLDRLSNAYNKFTVQMAHEIDLQRTLFRDTKRAGLDPNQITAILDQPAARVEASIAALPEKQRAVVQRWQEHFEGMRTRANETARSLGATDFEIKQLEGGRMGYVPHYLVDDIQVANQMRLRREEVEEILGVSFREMPSAEVAQTLRDYLRGKARGSTPVSEYVQGLMLTSGDSVLDSPDLLVRAISRAEDPARAGSLMQTRASALMRRGGRIPRFLRETDASKLMTKWNNSTYRHIYLRDGLAELRRYASALRQGGDYLTSGYISDHVADLTGLRAGTLATAATNAVKRLQYSALQRAEETENPIARATWRAAANFPELMRMASMQMYPYYLGLRADAVLRNMAQPFLMTGSEIGLSSGSYGTKLAARALFDSLGGLATGKSATKLLSEKGYLPAKFTGEAQDWMAKGMASSMDPNLRNRLGAAVRGLENLAMAAYSYSDVQNRLVTYGMTKMLAADMLRGVDEAVRLIPNIPPAYRAEVALAFRSGNEEGLVDSLADYLLSSTQFNYNRVSMSEYGRFMGFMFSMFSKWPSSILGDIVDTAGAMSRGDIQKWDGLRKLGWRYLGPTLAFGLLENTVLDGTREDPLRKALLGSNTATWSPATSLVPLLSGDFTTPPALAPVGQVFRSVASGRYDKLGDIAARNGVSALPGGIMYRFINEYLPMWMGERED